MRPIASGLSSLLLAFSLLCTLFKSPLLGLLGADATTRTATEAYMFWTVTCGACAWGCGLPELSQPVSNKAEIIKPDKSVTLA